jgi:hypothetical protein
MLEQHEEESANPSDRMVLRLIADKEDLQPNTLLHAESFCFYKKNPAFLCIAWKPGLNSSRLPYKKQF